MVTNKIKSLKILKVKKGDLYRPKKYARKIIAENDIWENINFQTDSLIIKTDEKNALQ